MLLSLFHPPCKVKKSLMHLDHSRGKKKKREKRANQLFSLFILNRIAVCLFVVLMHPLQAPFGLKGWLVWRWGFFFGYRFGGIFDLANLSLFFFEARLTVQTFEQPRLVNPVPVTPSSSSPETACSYCAAFIIKLVRCE